MSKVLLRTYLRKGVLALFLCAANAAQAAETFQFRVVRDKLLRDQSGQLTIDDGGITFRSDNGKTSLQFAYPDIRKADLSHPTVIRLHTYDRLKRKLGGHRGYEFRLKEDVTDSRLARFLTARLSRPAVADYELAGESPEGIPVYHRHRFRGCHGVLRIGEEGMRFSSQKPQDSRSWRYQDLETIGRSRPFDLRVRSYVETFNFELKSRLPEETYRRLWQRVHNSRDRTVGGN